MSVNLNASGGWAHLGWDPSKSSKTYDLTGYTNLELWIRSASGTLTDLQMEMHGTSGGCAWIYIRDYLSGGVTTTWQKVTIPLTAFQLDRTSVHTIDFWLGSGTAAFFIDDGRCY
jgi:hypothetical protein